MVRLSRSLASEESPALGLLLAKPGDDLIQFMLFSISCTETVIGHPSGLYL